MRLRRTLIALGALLLLCLTLPAQKKDDGNDDVVVLVRAKSAMLIDENGQSFRKVIGPARFLHNNTYLLCDSALWNVQTNIINAYGHVRIIQDRTQLTSETLEYVVDEDLAKFRGALVQLEDKDKNTLRTRYLDYNTRDSVAIFEGGASMRDKDGQIIESRFGSYDGKAGIFTFMDNVNMFTDSTFVKTSRLEYNNPENTAYFAYGTDAWEHDKMLSADDGWYNREKEIFFFRRNVHVMTKEYEGWSDTLYYHRGQNDVEMRGRAELMDTTRNIYALAGRLEYSDTLSRIKMTRDPAIMSITEENGQRDTLWFGADTLIHQSIRMCDIPESQIKGSKKRLEDISGDPVAEYRRKAAEAAAKAAAEAAAKDPNRPPERNKLIAPPPAVEDESEGESENSGEIESEGEDEPMDAPLPPVDSLAVPADTLTVPADTLTVPTDTLTAPPDTLSMPTDTLSMLPDSLESPESPVDTTSAPEPPKDTTRVGHVWAVNHVKLFRRDIQFACDSLVFTELDSLVRMYREPFIYNEGNRQYSADSIFVSIKDKAVDKANLLSNAFISIEQDSVLFDQIRSTEMVAYFDSTRALERFDGLGGASALFYLEENGSLATVNKVDAKMLYAIFEEGNINEIYYYESAKNDAYPIVQLPRDERFLKGYVWKPELRPSGPKDITSLVPRKSQRRSYEARPQATFPYTEVYFPGYIARMHREIALRDSLKAERDRQKEAADRERERFVADSIARASLDSLDRIVLPELDTLATPPAVDSLSTGKDSLSVPPADTVSVAHVPEKPEPENVEPETPEQRKERLKAEKAAAKEARRAERAARKKERELALEAKWAEEDRIYAEKQAAKRQKALEKERAKKLKQLKKREEKSRKERSILMDYIRKYSRERRR
ncbi:MAG: hypothetical protein IJR77_08505 [Bacteroidales bacterium]|nr:hypothetical protein [Bacteroidales bacterium]